MLLTILSSWVYVEKRRLIQVFPQHLQDIWNKWELRVMVLVSLFLQISLIYGGSCRKYNVRNWIRIFLWFAYLCADWVATVALGVLSNKQGDDCRCAIKKDKPENELAAFWAPFLLLHLGGPDTITAYALEDNELWLRHLLGLAVQFGVAIYVFLMAWNSSWVSFLSIPVMVAGCIKYGERTWALRSANREQFRDSLLTSPDPGPNYAKFMEELCLREAEGFEVTAAEQVEEYFAANNANTGRNEVNTLVKAHSLFHTFKRLFVDLILSFRDRDESQAYFQNLTALHNVNTRAEIAFQVIEIELGFAFDVFYTKAPLIYTHWGCILRLITIFSTTITFVMFLIREKGNPNHQLIDLIITCILLAGAIFLEMYAVILALLSDWTAVFLSEWTPGWMIRNSSRPSSKVISFIKKIILSKVISRAQTPNKQCRWSNSVAQFNLLSYCLKIKDKPEVDPDVQNRKFFLLEQLLKMRWCKILSRIPVRLMECVFDQMEEESRSSRDLEMLLYKSYNPVSSDLKGLVFDHFLVKSQSSQGELAKFCGYRGESLVPSEWTTEIEFDQSILIWHIATDLCYYSDDGDNLSTNNSHHKVSKRISDYMMYLLVMCPFMLPIGIGLIRFRDTFAEATQFFREIKPVLLGTKAEACKILSKVNTRVPPKLVKGDRSKSVLFDACRIASKLQEDYRDDKEKKWEIMSNVWVEILGYAASHCRGNYHAQQLRRGGELLTHVWLLMAHLGITEQIQISKGHARAMLTIK